MRDVSNDPNLFRDLPDGTVESISDRLGYETWFDKVAYGVGAIRLLGRSQGYGWSAPDDLDPGYNFLVVLDSFVVGEVVLAADTMTEALDCYLHLLPIVQAMEPLPRPGEPLHAKTPPSLPRGARRP